MNLPLTTGYQDSGAPLKHLPSQPEVAPLIIVLHVVALAMMLIAPKWGIVALGITLAGTLAFVQPRLLLFATVGFIWINEILADFLPGSPVTGWKDGLLLIALLVTSLRLAQRRQTILPQHALTVPVFVVALHFVVLCVLSDSAGQVFLGLKNSAFYMAWFFILPDIIRTRRDARTLVIALFVTALLLGSYNLWRVQQPFTSFPPFRDGRLLSGAARAHWGGATYIVPLGILLGLALAPNFKSWRQWLVYTMSLVAMAGLLVAGARAQTGCLMVSVLVMAVVSGRVKQTVAIAAAGLVLAIALQSVLQVDISDRAGSAFDDQDVSRQARGDETTDLMIPFVLKHPLGAGTGSMSASYSAGNVVSKVDSAIQGGMIHNNFLYIAIEIGWTGLLAWIWMLGVAIASAYRTFRSSQDPFVRNLALGLLCVVLQFSLMHFFAPMLTAALIGFSIWIFLGLIAALPQIDHETSDASSRLHG